MKLTVIVNLTFAIVAICDLAYACINVPPKMVYPTSYCKWGEDYVLESASIGRIKIDSLTRMYSSEETNSQHYTYIVYYSKGEAIYNTLPSQGVFTYQSFDICGMKIDLKMNIDSTYFVSLTKPSKVPYSDIYVDDAKTYIIKHDDFMILNRFTRIEEEEKIIN